MNIPKSYCYSIWVVSLSILLSIGIFIFNYEGPLEQIEMGSVDVKQGDSLRSVCAKIDYALKSDGSSWNIAIGSNVLERRSNSTFGGGGNALVVASIARNFKCKYIIIKSERYILIIAK